MNCSWVVLPNIDAMTELTVLQSEFDTACKKTQEFNLCVYSAREQYGIEHSQNLLYNCSNLVENQTQVKKAVVCLTSASEDYKFDVPNNITLKFVDNCLAVTHRKIIENQHLVNIKYNPKNTALYLMGKPTKIHRIGLLYKFYKQHQLGMLKHSAYLNMGIVNICKNILPESDDAFYAAINKHLDSIDIKMSDNGSHYDGVPYDVQLYETTGLSLISETHSRKAQNDFTDKLITEKTYRAMLNSHPFIIMASPGFIENLSDKGYKTFTEYLPIQYHKIQDINERMDAIVTCTASFLNNLTDIDFVKLISKDIEHSFDLVYNNGLQLNNELYSFFNGTDILKLTGQIRFGSV